MKPLLLVALLVLPLQATAASIPVVITFDQQVYERFGDLGPPSLQSMLDTLASGGTATASVGWYYGDWPSEDEETSYVSRYRGTYALDTTATAVPEPTSLLLLASGLALLRIRRQPNRRLTSKTAFVTGPTGSPERTSGIAGADRVVHKTIRAALHRPPSGATRCWAAHVC